MNKSWIYKPLPSFVDNKTITSGPDVKIKNNAPSWKNTSKFIWINYKKYYVFKTYYLFLATLATNHKLIYLFINKH